VELLEQQDGDHWFIARDLPNRAVVHALDAVFQDMERRQQLFVKATGLLHDIEVILGPEFATMDVREAVRRLLAERPDTRQRL
jgi:hypothetical protein